MDKLPPLAHGKDGGNLLPDLGRTLATAKATGWIWLELGGGCFFHTFFQSLFIVLFGMSHLKHLETLTSVPRSS